MDVGPGFGACDPTAGPVGGGRAAVKGGRQLQGDPGPARAAVDQVGGELLGYGVPARSGGHGDPGGGEAVHAATGHAGVGVDQPDDDAGDAGGDHGVGARRGASVMGAGLEGHEQRGAGRVGAGGPGRVQGHDLGVAAARRFRRPGEDATPGRDEHGPHPRVGRGGAAHGCGRIQRLAHPLLVAGHTRGAGGIIGTGRHRGKRKWPARGAWRSPSSSPFPSWPPPRSRRQ